MNMYLCILGRQPALGLAELENRFGADELQVIQSDIAQLKTDQPADIFEQLGGTQKVAKFLAYIDTTDWHKAARQVQKSLPQYIRHIPEGKITIGLSTYGLYASPQQINGTALSFKKVIKQNGRSVRVVPNNEPTLNAAQVIHNKLTSPNGLELLLIKDGGRIILAQTVWIQDIEAYRRRDQERPMRDARVGMLPPKLAQIILNLALTESQIDNPADTTVLDPFCGTGVVLQEATLMGFNPVGTDIEPRMVEYTNNNLRWLKDTILRGMSPQPALVSLRDTSHNGISPSTAASTAKVGDATSAQWRESFDTIATETFLGRPLSSQPDQETLQKIINDCSTIHRKFLQNVERQTKPGFRMCIAVPAWHAGKRFSAGAPSSFKHMPVLDHLEELGYNQVRFEHADANDLVYHRENQIVARVLVVLIRR